MHKPYEQTYTDLIVFVSVSNVCSPNIAVCGANTFLRFTLCIALLSSHATIHTNNSTFEKEPISRKAFVELIS